MQKGSEKWIPRFLYLERKSLKNPTWSNENCLTPIIQLRNSGNEKAECVVLVLLWNSE